MRALLWVAAVHAAALCLFTTGFFLTRFEVPDVSDCRVPPENEKGARLRLRSDAPPTGACWMPRRFRRVVFVVIDALRFDFVQSAASTSSSFYLRHLPILNATLTAEPAHSLLLKFVADAPTMTMQRLKGLTTGGLPTFLDIKDNMASAEITEDNLLLQLNRLRRPIVFMGDDTWDALYRHAFTRKYAFDSFNVKDLHSVDRGVERHLFPELQNDDWDLLIAHFLGVDHVGHTHGPSSPFMAEKLDEMNGLLTQLIETLANGREDTLLLVMGDHGMSADGNHGGASDDETGAALFAYSRQRLVDPDDAAAWPRDVPQVDLVPTLALLAGLPIPFGSLGAVIPQLFPSREALVHALRLNVAQVRRYLRTYSAASKLPQSEFDHLERLHATIESLGDTQTDALVAAQQTYLREALALGRSIWTQFDLCGMGWGLALLVAGQCLVVSLLVGGVDNSANALRVAVRGAVGGTFVGAIAPSALAVLPRTRLARVLALAALGSCVAPAVASRPTLPSFARWRRPTPSSVVAFAAVLLHALALLSNSYIVAEDRVMHFLTATVGCFLVWHAQRHAKPTFSVVASAIVFIIASRVLVAVDPPNIIHTTTSVTRTWAPLAAITGGFIVSQRRHVLSLLIVLAATFAVASYWFWSPLASSLWRLWLPRSVYLLTLGALGLQRHRDQQSLLVVLLMLALMLVLGPTSPLTLLCVALQHVSFARVAPDRPWPLAWTWLWSTACYQSFFTTGHQNTFTSLQNAAAFVGFDDFSFYAAGGLLGVNTFGSYALALVALAADRRAVLAAVAYFALNALVSTAFVALQRRHLMVWAIFAPKFIFDAATLVVVELVGVVALAIVTPSKAYSNPLQ